MRRARPASLVLALSLVLLPAAGAAPTDIRGGVDGFFQLEPDLRKCASPMCGGWWVTPPNRTSRTYAAELDLTALRLSAGARARLEQDLHAGRAILRGRLVRGTIEAFPRLAVLRVSETWRAPTAERASGTVFRVVDRGLRCIAPPCFQWHAAALSTTRHANVSELQLGAIPSEAVRGRVGIAAVHARLLAEGRLKVVPDAGPAGNGVALVVTQVWFQTAAAGG